MAAHPLVEPALAAIVFSYQHGLTPLEAIARAAMYSKRRRMGDSSSVFFFDYVSPNWTERLRSEDLCLPVDSTSDERFPLHLAIVHGNAQLVAYILRYERSLVSAEAIDCAFVSGHVPIVRLLLKQREVVDELRTCVSPVQAIAPKPRPEARMALPSRAVQSLRGSLAMARDALAKRMGLFRAAQAANEMTSTSSDLPKRIAHHNSRELYVLLASYTTRGWTPDALAWATKRRAPQSVRFLKNRCTPPAGSLIEAATVCGDLAVVKRLHASGSSATSDAVDRAASCGYLDIVAFLHEHYPATVTDTALNMALNKCYPHVVTYLLDHCPHAVCSREAFESAVFMAPLAHVVALIDRRPMRLGPDFTKLMISFAHTGIFRCADEVTDVIKALVAARCIEWTPYLVAHLDMAEPMGLHALARAEPGVRWPVAVCALCSGASQTMQLVARLGLPGVGPDDDAFGYVTTLTIVRLFPRAPWRRLHRWLLQTTDDVSDAAAAAHLYWTCTGRRVTDEIDPTLGGATITAYRSARTLDPERLLVELCAQYPSMLTVSFLDAVAVRHSWMLPVARQKLVRWWCDQFFGHPDDLADLLAFRHLQDVFA
ncbi:hypothetical protein SDRG_15669 [Saprolegnia diclina VS20]|uniref:Uncharacterized protein n=1 Tax=Saprolegnia diclina (strain VS20) TaxID=1156394 RepID=T0PWA8_SAPDV|nr:hypothetical protein SDRG_15669 [Saprolegnia diclina VS20]EQC26491.1 hypothetical protein SDRG_15669 [Saprolegnia diclina VS20]|eukprot:XP_008620070.1 hypothetical protein SDRG_15669 [Saprolegnia diclina VS20]